MALDHQLETPVPVAENQPCKSGKNVDPCCINLILTDDCLRAILSKLQSQNEKDICSLVCKRWLVIQSSERKRIGARAGPLMLQRLAARFINVLELNLGQSASRSFFPGVSDSDLQTVSRSFRILEHIDLQKCTGITDKGLEALAKGIPCLKSVSLSGCKRISSKGIESLASSCNKLVRLHLAGCRLVNDSALEALSRSCKDLELLDLSNCIMITDKGVQALANGCCKLHTLNISACEKVGDAGVSSLGSLNSSLQFLNLSWCPKVTDESIILLTRQLGLLETLLLSRCKLLTDASAVAVAEKCGESLRHLSLDDCREITDEAFVQVFQRCKVMETLDLCSTQITDSALNSLQENGERLRDLRLSCCSNISDSGVSKIGSLCTSLELIDLRWCDRVTPEGLLATRFPPTCKVLRV